LDGGVINELQPGLQEALAVQPLRFRGGQIGQGQKVKALQVRFLERREF
jgi:hypothetical protein